MPSIVHHLSGPNVCALGAPGGQSRPSRRPRVAPGPLPRRGGTGITRRSGRSQTLHFHCAFGFFGPQSLAHKLDSLVRVSRRVGENASKRPSRCPFRNGDGVWRRGPRETRRRDRGTALRHDARPCVQAPARGSRHVPAPRCRRFPEEGHFSRDRARHGYVIPNGLSVPQTSGPKTGRRGHPAPPPGNLRRFSCLARSAATAVREKDWTPPDTARGPSRDGLPRHECREAHRFNARIGCQLGEPARTRNRGSIPTVYLWTVSRTVELSLQSSFQLSLTVLVHYRSRSGI